jgi:hypothetical protein
MIVGGMLGFLIGVGVGLLQENSWPSILWKSSLIAYVIGLLFRWWGRVWIQNLEQAQREQIEALEALENQSDTAAKTNPN